MLSESSSPSLWDRPGTGDFMTPQRTRCVIYWPKGAAPAGQPKPPAALAPPPDWYRLSAASCHRGPAQRRCADSAFSAILDLGNSGVGWAGESGILGVLAWWGVVYV